MKKILSFLFPLSITLSLISGVAVNSAPAAPSNVNITKYKELRDKDKSYFEGIIKKYTDMGNHWGLVSVATLSDIDIIDGYPDGSFKPDNSISRAEYTKLLLTALMKEPVSGNSFLDTSNHWAKDILNTAVASGIIVKAEYGDSFSPDRKITRVEMAKMVVRAIGLGSEAEKLAGQATTFADDAAFIPTDKGYVKVASEKGIISGYLDGTFRPNGQATRTEASQMVINMLEYLVKQNQPAPTLVPTPVATPVSIPIPVITPVPLPTPTPTPAPSSQGVKVTVGTAKFTNGMTSEIANSDPVLVALMKDKGIGFIGYDGPSNIAIQVSYFEKDKNGNDNLVLTVGISQKSKGYSFNVLRDSEENCYRFKNILGILFSDREDIQQALYNQVMVTKEEKKFVFYYIDEHYSISAKKISTIWANDAEIGVNIVILYK